MSMRPLIDIVNEVDIGGAVEPDHLQFIRSLHNYENPQRDLFPEIPTLDPALPPDMKIVGKLGALRVVHRREYDSDDYLLFDKERPIAWITLTDPESVHRNIDVIIRHGEGKQVVSVYIEPEYRGQNLGIKLYHWVLSNVCDYLVADELQTRAGVRLWKKLLNSRLFDVEVADTRSHMSRKRWAGKDFNQVYNLPNGDLIPWVTLRGKAEKLLHDA